MKLDNKTLMLLKASLPKGYAKMIQVRISIKYSLTYAISYINQVLNPNDKRFNDKIQEEALILAEETKQRKTELSMRVAALKNS